MELPFYVVTAFTTNPYGGNPAAVVFVDDLQDGQLLHNLAKNFNQPMAMFLRRVLTDGDPTESATFEARWFTKGGELPLCGHATIAASGLMFFAPDMHLKQLKTITYKTTGGLMLTARRADDWVQLSLVAAGIEELPPAESARLRDVLTRAFGKEIDMRFAGRGLGFFDRYLLLEIGVPDDLGGSKPKTEVLVETGYEVNVVTSAAPNTGYSFVSRMFAPTVDVPEDHVCGSAHCLLAPYWAKKLEKANTEMMAKQVSLRGGEIKATWRKSEGLITLAGQTRLIMKGSVLL